ncbi:MAG: hypothetical protein DDT24_00759 [Chloroflexi bacterium]|nr:hypothetical protein [Chloroflexota bacterium]
MRGIKLRTGSGVDRDEIDVAIEPSQEAGQLDGKRHRVVDAAYEGIFESDPATGGLNVTAASRDKHLQGIHPVGGCQEVAELVVGGMQGDRQPHLQLFLAQFLDGGGNPDRGDGYVPCPKSE